MQSSFPASLQMPPHQLLLCHENVSFWSSARPTCYSPQRTVTIKNVSLVPHRYCHPYFRPRLGGSERLSRWPRELSQGGMAAAEAPAGVGQWSPWVLQTGGPGPDPSSTLTSGDSAHITGHLRSRRDATSQALAKSRHVVGAQVNAAAVLTDKLTAPADPARPGSETWPFLSPFHFCSVSSSKTIQNLPP